MRLTLHSPTETTKLAKQISKSLRPGHIIGLFGELGSGKTTFVKGLAAGLNVKPDQVHSPTFVFLNIYEGKLPLYHFDLYRVEDIHQIGGLGYDEFFYGQGVAVIEWAERLKELMPKEYLKVELEHRGENERELRLTARGQKYNEVVEQISKLKK